MPTSQMEFMFTIATWCLFPTFAFLDRQSDFLQRSAWRSNLTRYPTEKLTFSVALGAYWNQRTRQEIRLYGTATLAFLNNLRKCRSLQTRDGWILMIVLFVCLKPDKHVMHLRMSLRQWSIECSVDELSLNWTALLSSTPFNVLKRSPLVL